MRPEKLTVKAQEALSAAQGEARRRDHQAIEVEHLLLALLEQEEGVARPILDKIGADPARVASRVEDELRSVAKVAGAEPYLAHRLAKLLDRAEAEAKKLKDEYVSTEHLLLAAAAEKTRRRRARCARAGATRDALLRGARRTCAAARASPSPEPGGASTRRSRSTRATSPSSPARASSTR